VFAAVNKETLPVPITGPFPQIMLMELVDGLSAWSVVDTTASLCTESSHFSFHLGKSYPEFSASATIYISNELLQLFLFMLPSSSTWNLDYFTMDGY
jgi:hypothetical protein